MKAVISKWSRSGIRVATGALCATVLVAGMAHAALHGSGKLEFHAKGPMGLKIDGTGPLSVTEEGGILKFSSPFAKLDTGMELRNKHMRERMHAGKHPTVTFQIERSKLKVPADGQQISVEKKDGVTGTVQLNGVSKPVTIAYKAKRVGNEFTVAGGFDINVSNHGISEKDLCEMGVCAKPDVTIVVSFKLNE